MSAPIITVERLGKRYRLGAGRSNERYTALRDVIASKARSLFRGSQPAVRNGHETDGSEFWALKNINFEVKEGEVLGIIGRNGAGKSTLLKILSRITEPTEGRVRIKGRVASLLEVGTGFHPELTGRENIYLNGAILGMRRAEIKAKFDEIVAFAEVEKFLDTPVKRYSSGMYVRLAFAVAAHLDPEILVVDEVLAVGDAQFQKKCLGKMKQVSRGEGRTVLFVSHNMGTVTSLCPYALWLDGGEIRQRGAARSVINDYLRQRGSDGRQALNLAELPRVNAGGDRLKLELLEWLCNLPLQHGEPVRARISFRIMFSVQDATVGLGFSTTDGTRLLTYETDFQESHRPNFSEAGTHSAEVEIDTLPLAPGIYSLDIGCRSGDFHGLDYLPGAAQLEVIPGPKTPAYIIRQGAGVRLPSRWSWDS